MYLYRFWRSLFQFYIISGRMMKIMLSAENIRTAVDKTWLFYNEIKVTAHFQFLDRYNQFISNLTLVGYV